MSPLALFTPALEGAYEAVSGIAAILAPLLGGTATAASIILCTALVRLLLHPLSRAQFRAERARAALAPAVVKLRVRHKKDPLRLQKEIAGLYEKEGVSMTAGVLPMLAQAPALFVMYRLFISRSVAGHANTLLTHGLFGVALGSRISVGGIAVFAALIAVMLATATWTVLRTRKALPITVVLTRRDRLVQLLPYGTAITATIVPLATGLYIATTSLWTAAERAFLARERHADV